MCIICASRAGVKQPTQSQIETMFSRNPHGAGYMYARDGKVTIHKGFMNLDDLLRQLEREKFTEADPVVYHFRISTQAGGLPSMTHPFPLTKELKICEALDVRCTCGIAHNGIINLTSTGSKRYSDTALFITKYMSKIVKTKADLEDKSIIEILELLTGSKLAILDSTGDITTVGDFIKDDGLLFSNYSYTNGNRHGQLDFSKFYRAYCS